MVGREIFMKKIGITGYVGAGKSLVGEILRSWGYATMDADKAVHQLYKECLPLRNSIAAAFGEDSLNAEGVNRQFFANLVFRDPEARQKLEGIVYPYLIQETLRFFEVNAGSSKASFVEAAVLYKVPEVVEALDEIWIVNAPEEIRMERLVSQRNFTIEDALRRIQMQKLEVTSGAYIGKVVRAIENGGSRENLEQILRALISNM